MVARRGYSSTSLRAAVDSFAGGNTQARTAGASV